MIIILLLVQIGYINTTPVLVTNNRTQQSLLSSSLATHVASPKETYAEAAAISLHIHQTKL